MNALNLTDGILACPGCGNTFTHLESVYAITRDREDAEPRFLCLDNSGSVTPINEEAYPDAFGDTGRRHEFALTGYCEMCGTGLRITFRQHKGETWVRVGRPT